MNQKSILTFGILASVILVGLGFAFALPGLARAQRDAGRDPILQPPTQDFSESSNIPLLTQISNAGANDQTVVLPTDKRQKPAAPIHMAELPKTTASVGKISSLPGTSEAWWAQVQSQMDYATGAGMADTPVLTLTGENNDDNFGYSVVSAGDVNGDGYADAIVGAYDFPSGFGQGKAYIYHGSPNGLVFTPALTLTGQNNNDWFGHSVASAGDVNGDGYADAIVGAYGFPGGFVQGKAYIYHGSPDGLVFTPALTLTGQNNIDHFGYSVASAGDVNGDGYADAIVGAFASSTMQGKTYVYHGSADGLADTPALTLTGQNNNDRFGYSVASAGDVNGDGYADAIVGAYGFPSGSAQGKAYVYHGSADGLADTPALTLTGQYNSDLFGYSVASAGDVNGDGYADVIVGAFGFAFPGGSYMGSAYVYHGSPAGLSATPALTLYGQNNDDHFGYSIASAGDLNGDGYADAIVGAFGFPDGSEQGIAYIYHGSANGLADTPAHALTGQNNNDRFGYSVASAGDVNGDGYADTIVGAYAFAGGSYKGRAYIYHGSSDGLVSSPILTLTGQNNNDYFGFSVASAGDVNGDGYTDAIVGAYGFPNGSNEGRVYIYHGSPDGLSVTPALTLTGQNNSDYFGFSVASAGDVNGDGFADAIVGSFGFPSYSSRGNAYIYHGSPAGLAFNPVLTLTGQNNGDRFGYSVVSAGDVNGDGYADAIVGAYGFPGGSEQGRAYIYHGSPDGLVSSPILTLIGQNNSDYFGFSVASAGDVNGDGYADAIVGAWGFTGEQGKAYVYHGSPDGLVSSPALTLTGQYSSDNFGFSVASAGNVNGDGYADAILGAPGFPGGSGQGSAYIYSGSPSGLVSSPILTLTGQNNSDSFGVSVASAGDVNGDGYADAILGAFGFPGSGRGSAYIYSGSPFGLVSSPALTLTGQNNNDFFGRSVASAGDVNGDGYADAIVGAWGFNGEQGMAYVYHGNNEDGRTVLSRQVRADWSGMPVQPWGISRDSSAFLVRMAATSPYGRLKVKLEVQVCAAGTAFGDTTCQVFFSPSWNDVTATSGGVTLTVPATDLKHNTLYRWRVRVLYAPFTVDQPGITPPTYPAHGPWRRYNGQAVEADIRTSPKKSITVELDGSGNGTISSDPPGISCPGDCVGLFDFRTDVTLTATANSGSSFSGWSGAGCSGTGDCVLTMTEAKSVTAEFTLDGFKINLPIAPR